MNRRQIVISRLRKHLLFTLAILFSTLFTTNIFAGVLLGSTRVIFDAEQRSASTVVSNVTSQDYAVQVWVNDQSDSADSAVPFIAMPALFRVRPGGEQVVRIIKTPGDLPQDRESVFYLNAQEIPVAVKGEQNVLKVAIRTRIKLFYRPKVLMEMADEGRGKLSWSLREDEKGVNLRVDNPTPYFVTFAGVRVSGQGQSVELKDMEMIAPKSVQEYPLGHKMNTDHALVEFSMINDYGGYTKPLKVDVRKNLN